LAEANASHQNTVTFYTIGHHANARYALHERRHAQRVQRNHVFGAKVAASAQLAALFEVDHVGPHGDRAKGPDLHLGEYDSLGHGERRIRHFVLEDVDWNAQRFIPKGPQIEQLRPGGHAIQIKATGRAGSLRLSTAHDGHDRTTDWLALRI
jgi:hypothetical protein